MARPSPSSARPNQHKPSLRRRGGVGPGSGSGPLSSVPRYGTLAILSVLLAIATFASMSGSGVVLMLGSSTTSGDYEIAVPAVERREGEGMGINDTAAAASSADKKKEEDKEEENPKSREKQSDGGGGQQRLINAVPRSAKEWRANKRVSCGGHFAASCWECPQGHGEAYCHGECAWDAAKNGCVERTSNVHENYHSLCKQNYAFQPVMTDGGTYVNIILVRAPLRSEREWKEYERHKDDILFLGISSFESFPLSSPNPFSTNFSNSLYTGMFPGFLHMMHEPEKHFPPHVKLLLMSQSDFSLPRDAPAEDKDRHQYDFTFSGTDQNVDTGCVGWASFAKNWSFVLEALEVMCSDEFDLRGVLVASRNKKDTRRCSIPPECEGKMTQTKFLTQGDFFKYVKRSRFAFVPQIYDASPRVTTQALSLDVPLLMNRHILGGWKYMTEETGEFFSDMSDFRESLRTILRKVKEGAYHPRKWVLEQYGDKKSGKKLLDFVKEHFADRVELPEGTKYLLPTGA